MAVRGLPQRGLRGWGKLPPLVVTEGKSAYLNPQVAFPAGPREYDGQGYRNSGVPPEDPRVWASLKHRYRLRFTKPGTYVYTCIVHGPAMSGVVRVHRRGGGYLATRRRPSGRAGRNSGPPCRPGNRPWQACGPRCAAGACGSVPPFVIPQMQAGGPPRLLLNPKVAAPTPHREYAGSGYVNSGILVPLGAPGPRTYRLRFDRPGTYTYCCPIHAPLGMKGVVVVR